MIVTAVNESQGQVLAPWVTVAESLVARSKGLLGTAALLPEEGMWLNPCRSVHTFFMRFSIDVLFLDPGGVVVSKTTMRPWRLSKFERKAASVLELAAGTLDRKGTRLGDRITFKRI